MWDLIVLVPDHCLSFYFEGLSSIPTDDLIPLVRRCRNHHSMAYRVPIANTNIYKCSFFPQTIRDWNTLPDSLISSAEGAEDGCCQVHFSGDS